MKERQTFGLIRLIRKSEKGAAAAEYALILAIIGSVIAIAALGLGGAIGGAMDTTKNCLLDTTTC
ncbi:MAG: Flp family type IVb pilin [Alphaproteobacteria bacterium]|nr:MAG: Flp family type IVb pilin [Alphaproteobacteria bacterium]